MMNNGNHYHPADGVFVAPISGVYMFAWNTLTHDSNYLFTELRVENEVKVLWEVREQVVITYRDQDHYYVMSEKETTSGYRQAVCQAKIIYIIGMNLRHSWDFCFRKINFVVLNPHPRPTHSPPSRTHLFDIESLKNVCIEGI